ncbi:Telomerase reverse transcriptase [Mycena chlorophos]|uniref:Telomerase reverse transcriptase n=1 Tax=Mycena chlorophos TaxID=658473 RepID=A0A8H6TFU5_MYCCL|nr:Telomerase reverse transcriptase [Mycena chlorophos]
MVDRISVRLLNKHYGTVHSLASYLDATPSTSDSQAYKTLLSTSFVCRDGNHTLPRFPYLVPHVDIRTVIHSAIAKLLSGHTRKCRNIIAQGYNLNLDGKEVRNVVLNTNVTALQAPEWELLHDRVGTDAMVHLLTETSVFVALPNDCLCQLVGIPITANRLENLQLFDTRATVIRPPKRTASTSSEELSGPAKRVRLNSGLAGKGNSNVQLHERSPAKLLLSRNRLFYGRVTEKGRTNGLPAAHILNKVKAKKETEDMDVNDPRKQMEAARKLSKYVFPRQFGLQSAFAFESASSVLPDFGNMDRDGAIASLGRCKTPKRLKEVVSMLEKAIWRHGRCCYWQLRDLACPSQVRQMQKRGWKTDDILEHLAHLNLQSSAPRSQMPYNADASYDTDGDTISAIGLTQARDHARRKPHLAEMACSHDQVFRYAMLATKTVFPNAFWGSRANFLHIMKKVKTFISCRRFETLSLHNIMQGFNTSDCEWLMPPGSGARQTRVPVTDALKRRELLEEWLFWYFDSFLIPLLKTTFYVTESSALRNQVLYFRQDDWAFVCAPLLESLTETTYQRVSADEAAAILRNRSLGYSFVRLLPKEAGVRPIVNLKRKQKVVEGGWSVERSINQVLQVCFRILSYERDARKELVGASVFNMNDVYARLKEFKARLPKRLPKLYFVKVDVQACFDTIPQGKLVEILHELLSEDKYIVQRFSKVTSEAGKVKRTFLTKASGGDEHPGFLETAKELASALHSTIFADEVRFKQPRRAEILELLQQHIHDSIVKIGSEFYRQMIGIPQGSVLSSILCAFFYGDLEKKFRKFTDDEHSMLIRQTDDYLFISADENQARRFLDVMNQGHPEWGCFISPDKTVTNFDVGATLQDPECRKNFPWCGLLLDTKHLTVSVEYARYAGSDLADTLTIGRGTTPGAVFRYKMLQLAKGRCHLIYNDINLNSENVVCCNIYENFLLCALKMHVYLRGWGLDTRKHGKFIYETIRQMLTFCYNSISNKTDTRLARQHGGRANIDKAVVVWLGSRAFHEILSRHPTRYASVVRRLKAYLETPRAQRFARRYRKLLPARLGKFLVHFRGSD